MQEKNTGSRILINIPLRIYLLQKLLVSTKEIQKSYNLFTMNDPFKDLINLKEASIISGLSSDHLRQLMEKGTIAGKKMGRDWITTDYYVVEYIKKKNRPLY